MRRCLATLLLALLPFQFSWAAVAVYCGHESESRGGHVGHHAHQHADAGDSHQAAAAEKATGNLDFDCGHCHGACMAPPAPVAAAGRASAGAQAVPGGHGIASSVSPNPPERPQWAGLA
jgi:hypothetical protein